VPRGDIDELKQVIDEPAKVDDRAKRITGKVYDGAITLAGGVTKAVAVTEIVKALTSYFGG
jgi:hypothetical protein